MSNYPAANRSSSWFATKYRGSAMDPNCGVLHTTEGTSLPSYGGGATAPHYTAVPDLVQKRLRWYAHFPDEVSARALRNTAGGVETNTANCLQVELVGTCDPGTAARWRAKGARFIYWPDAPDWALRDLAAFIADRSKAHGIPITGPGSVWTAYPESYGSGGQRFTHARWRAFRGWCGHQHVPENTHGDPGALKWGVVEGLARKAAGVAPDTAKPQPPKVTTPGWDAIVEAAADTLARTPADAPARRAALATILRIGRAWSAKH